VIDEIMQPAVKSAMAIYAITANYEKARKTKNQEEMAKWSRPLGGMLKLNVDAAFNHDTNACATGVVIRDEKGGFITARSKKIYHAFDGGSREMGTRLTYPGSDVYLC
jgi:hypothetical protein